MSLVPRRPTYFLILTKICVFRHQRDCHSFAKHLTIVYESLVFFSAAVYAPVSSKIKKREEIWQVISAQRSYFIVYYMPSKSFGKTVSVKAQTLLE
jgi:hypothetical protein